MKNLLTTVAELAGFGLITAGCALIWAPLGFIVGGALLALVAFLVDRGDGL